jgi:hypothetical protein
MAPTLAQVRLRIQDQWRYGEEIIPGDGTASAFKLSQGAPHSTLISATASVAVAAGWSATGCTIDNALGRAVFPTAISANSGIHYGYLWAVFSDAEIGEFTAAGSLAGAALEAVRTLRFNAPKRARWAAPDGTQYDDSRVSRDLKELEDDLQEEVIRYSEGPEGGYESWAAEQGNY